MRNSNYKVLNHFKGNHAHDHRTSSFFFYLFILLSLWLLRPRTLLFCAQFVYETFAHALYESLEESPAQWSPFPPFTFTVPFYSLTTSAPLVRTYYLPNFKVQAEFLTFVVIVVVGFVCFRMTRLVKVELRQVEGQAAERPLSFSPSLTAFCLEWFSAALSPFKCPGTCRSSTQTRTETESEHERGMSKRAFWKINSRRK